MAKEVRASDAGIHADFHILHSIHRAITRAMFSQQDGDNVLCINFLTCRKDYLSMAAQAVDVVQGHVRLI